MPIKSLAYRPNTLDWFDQFHDLPYSVLFDSGHPQHESGAWDIFSALPSESVFITPGGIFHQKEKLTQLDEIHALKALLSSSQTSEISDIPFTGGWMGHANYELGGLLEPNEIGLQKPSEQPLFWAGYYEWAILTNHQTQQSFFITLDSIDKRTLTIVNERLATKVNLTASFTLTRNFQPQIDKPSYEKQFTKIKGHIEQGDCYQVNYTFPFKGEYSGCTYEAYKKLREASPSPFMAYLNHNYQLLSLSPERFIWSNGKQVLTQPIKGTIKRNKESNALDSTQKQTLASSAKDRAENIMIVDLLRNDLAKHAEPDSVQVTALCDVQSFANVHHLVSTVSCTLRKDSSIWDLFFDAFPGGSITGAPKIRACQIINEAEPAARNAYCGSLFYASNNGYFDSNILIRTATCHKGDITLQAGGGIVADSTLENEYEECLTKINHLITSLRLI